MYAALWALRYRRRIASLLVAAVVAAALALGMVTIAVGAAVQTSTEGAAGGAGAPALGCVSGGAGDALAGIPDDQHQHDNAATIVATAKSRGLPQRASIISLATAYQESNFVNYQVAVDHDSLGVFQQREMYYGRDVAADVARSTGAFLDRLVLQPNWQTRALTDVAADVQQPYEPYRGLYAQWEDLATRITTQLWGGCEAARAGPVLTSSGRILRDGEEIDCITNAILDAVEAVVGPVRVMQGSWSTSVKASGTTHAAAGASDWYPVNGDYATAVEVARANGGIAWHRTPAQGFAPHIHMIVDEQGISDSAAGQVLDFEHGGDGLNGPGVDDGPADYQPYSGSACAA